MDRFHAVAMILQSLCICVILFRYPSYHASQLPREFDRLTWAPCGQFIPHSCAHTDATNIVDQLKHMGVRRCECRSQFYVALGRLISLQHPFLRPPKTHLIVVYKRVKNMNSIQMTQGICYVCEAHWRVADVHVCRKTKLAPARAVCTCMR